MWVGSTTASLALTKGQFNNNLPSFPLRVLVYWAQDHIKLGFLRCVEGSP